MTNVLLKDDQFFISRLSSLTRVLMQKLGIFP